jgi:hypothetical protein
VTAALVLALLLPLAAAGPDPQPTPASATWPGSLRNGLPLELRGYASAPKDPFPDTDENEMGIYTQVSRRYQYIQSATFAKSLVLIVQDYGRGKDLAAPLRNAMREAGKVPGFSGKEQSIGGRTAFVVFHREGDKPVTVVTVMATPSRVVLGLGDNIDEAETVKLVSQVDFQKIADAK